MRTTATVAERPGGRATFGRRSRLLHAADFDGVFREGQRSADRYFTVLFRPNDCGEARLGFAISRQRVRLAVGRNRLRRLVRESFRLIRTDFPPVDIVIMARDAAGAATRPDLGQSLERHWARLRKTTTSEPRT